MTQEIRNSNQLNAILTERLNVKLMSPLSCSAKVKSKSGSIVGYPPFIKNMFGAVKISISGKRISGMSECGIKISDYILEAAT